jgi:hypothetical protein
MKTARVLFALTVFASSGALAQSAETASGETGAGNAAAVKLASSSPLVRSAYALLLSNARRIRDPKLLRETLDGLANPQTCVRHRAGEADHGEIIAALIAQGLLSPADAAKFPGGAEAGVFPAVLDDDSDCPKLPQPFLSAPGSTFGGHHSYPGGLPVHVAFNDTSDINLASGYRKIYGHTGLSGLAEVAALEPTRDSADTQIDEDIVIGAPLWHDWAKTIVMQWNADGTEFPEFSFGGNGSTDAYGATGDSRTGAHHILGIAETIERGLTPEFVIAQASAHNTPTSGGEYKVVNWLRAAAIIAGVDPVATGYLIKDSKGQLRLPAVRALGELDLNAAGQTNFIVEWPLHNLSDADYSCTGPAVSVVQIVLNKLAPEYGYDASDVSRYNNGYRNVALNHLSAERLLMIYSNSGLRGVRRELNKLRARKLI